MKLDLQDVLIELEHYRERKARVDPDHAALIVIDMQNYFRRIVLPILENILEVIRFCRGREIPVIFTQHGHTDPVSDGGLLRDWWGELIMDGTEDWEFLPEIRIGPKDTVLPKKRYSAFFQTDLERILQSRGIRDLIISGVMTNLCCETTARDAFMKDYRVFFLIDGTATRRRELHLATLKNLGFGFAYLLTCEELAQMLKSSKEQ
ncbi:MAG: isochorismatase family protein [Syntrophaceae bacterium]|nr:isochorismatase family protein [Syntrophaceae bacterium]